MAYVTRLGGRRGGIVRPFYRAIRWRAAGFYAICTIGLSFYITLAVLVSLPLGMVGSALVDHRAGSAAVATVAPRCCSRPPCATISTPPSSSRNGIYPRVLIVGDSLTAGFNASSLTSGYAYCVAALLHQRNAASAVSYALWGNCGMDSVTHAQQIAAMGVPHADLIVLELGTVEHFPGLPGGNISLAEFDAEYAAVLAQLQEASPAATIVALGVWEDATTPDSTAATGADFDGAIQSELAKTAFPVKLFVPLSGIYSTAGTRYTSGETFHPNDTGYAQIATAILQVV